MFPPRICQPLPASAEHKIRPSFFHRNAAHSEVEHVLSIPMNNHPFTITAISRIILVCGLFAFGGCASWDASNQEALLSAAGFSMRKPETAKQQEIYQAMEPYKVQATTVNGKLLYAYKHEKKGVVYVGGEPEYQRYQKLAIEQRIAQQNYMAAQMNQDLSLRWRYWGGPWGYWW